MDNIVKVAIAKIFDKQTEDFKPTPGTHEIDQIVTIHVKGTLVKSADGETTPTVDIPLLATMALLMEKAGFQRELGKKLVTEAMIEALALQKKGKEFVEGKTKDIDEAMKHVRQITEKLPKKPKSGPTKVQVEIVEIMAEEAA